MSKNNTFFPAVNSLVYALRQFPKGHAGRTHAVMSYCTEKGMKFLADVTPETPIEIIRKKAMQAVSAGY